MVWIWFTADGDDTFSNRTPVFSVYGSWNECFSFSVASPPVVSHVITVSDAGGFSFASPGSAAAHAVRGSAAISISASARGVRLISLPLFIGPGRRAVRRMPRWLRRVPCPRDWILRLEDISVPQERMGHVLRPGAHMDARRRPTRWRRWVRFMVLPLYIEKAPSRSPVTSGQ